MYRLIKQQRNVKFNFPPKQEFPIGYSNGWGGCFFSTFLADLKLAVETVRELSLPFGVVINQCDIGDNQVEVYCRKEEISILEQIPHDRSAAEDYSRGYLLVESSKDMRAYFDRLADKVLDTNRELSTRRLASS